MDNHMYGYMPNVYYEPPPCIYYPNSAGSYEFSNDFGMFGVNDYSSQHSGGQGVLDEIASLVHQMAVSQQYQPDLTICQLSLEEMVQQMAENNQRMAEQNLEFQQRMEASNLEFQQRMEASRQDFATQNALIVSSLATLQTPHLLEEHTDSQIVVPDNTSSEDNFDNDVKNTFVGELCVESPDIHTFPYSIYYTSCADCNEFASCVACFERYEEQNIHMEHETYEVEGPVQPRNTENEDQEDICFTMLEDDEEPLELDDSINSYACVECDGMDELCAEFPDIRAFSDSVCCTICTDCTNSNLCVVCAEISACIAGDGFVSAVNEDRAEVKAAPETLSTYLPPPPVEPPAMEFKPLDFAPLDMKALWPVQEVEPHFYWEDFVDKIDEEVIFDPRGSEKSAALGEFTIIVKCSPPYQGCKLGDHGISFRPLSIIWALCCMPWDPGGSYRTLSIPWPLYHRQWDPGGTTTMSFL